MWKDIKGWEQYYEVDENGNVRNKITKKVINGDTNSAGYQRVCLQNKNNIPNRQRFFRHRLVAKTFLENPYNLPEVNHKDNNQLNNNINNLEYCTRKENERQSHVNGNKPYRPFIVEFSSGEIKQFDTKPQLAEMLNVSRTLVEFWLNGCSETYHKYGINNIGYI